MSTVRVATIGAGRFANTVHYPSLHDLADVELAAVADIDETRLAETANKYGVGGRFSDYRRMIEQVKPDAVYVLMPPAPMVSIALEVLGRGIPVFIEKPPGLTLADAEALAGAARRAGTFGMVGFNRCYNPTISEVRRRLAGLGSINLAVAEFHKPPHPTYQSYGSHIVADVIHVIAVLHFVGGNPGSIRTVSRSIGEEGAVDLATALIDFDQGTVGVLISNFTSGSRYERFELHATRGGAYILTPDTRDGPYPKAPSRAEIYVEGRGIEVLDGFQLAGSSAMHKAFGYFDESKHFAECVRSGAAPNTSLDFGVAVMRTAIEIDVRLSEKAAARG